MFSARLVSLFFILFAAFPAVADELTPAKRADIERLLELTGALDIGKQMSAAVTGRMAETVRQVRPDIPASVIGAVAAEVHAVVNENMDGFIESTIPLYHKYFTSSDIKGMIEFYSTELGRKTIRVMPALLAESMQAGQRWGESLEPLLNQRIRERFKSEGYEI